VTSLPFYVKMALALESAEEVAMAADTAPEGVDGVSVIGALAEPTRRQLYELVAASADWVSREAAAEALGLERGTVAHHLDRLAADGLLEVDFQRLSGRRGPGAGRPAKLYRRARREVGVSLPPRDYALAGELLAEAAERSSAEGTDIKTALDDAARSEGAHLAATIEARVRASGARSAAAKRRIALDALAEHGFEPRTTEDGTVVLQNCPFHQLAQRHTELICGMNLCLVDAALGGVEAAGLEARLEPEEGLCCVKLHPTG
jgi:predicted ArsR family transcriptional regulator